MAAADQTSKSDHRLLLYANCKPAQTRTTQYEGNIESKTTKKINADLAHVRGLSTRPTICSVGDAQRRAAQPFFHDVARISYSQRTEKKKKRASAVAVEEPLPCQGGEIWGTRYFILRVSRAKIKVLYTSLIDKERCSPGRCTCKESPNKGTCLVASTSRREAPFLALRTEEKPTCKRRGSSFQRLHKGCF